VAAECDLCRSANPAELRLGVVVQHRIGLLNECIDRLFGAATHKVGQGLNVIRPSSIQLGREAPWEDTIG